MPNVRVSCREASGLVVGFASIKTKGRRKKADIDNSERPQWSGDVMETVPSGWTSSITPASMHERRRCAVKVEWKRAPVITGLHGSHSCFFLSSRGLCCCNIVIKTKALTGKVTPGAEVWWQLKLEPISSLEWVCVEAVPNACGMCYWVCWMRGLPKGRGRKWAWKREKHREKGGGRPLKSTVRKLWLNL